jgi:hypothetical protein
MKILLAGITLFTAFFLILPGVLVKYYKAYWLISGYNTMSKEKKKNVDVEGLSQFKGNICFIMAAIIILAGLFTLIDKMAVAGIIFALIVPASIYTIIKAQKYDGNTRNADGTMKSGTKVIVGAISAFLVLVLVSVGILIFNSNKPSQFLLNDGYLQIMGLYGEKISIGDIKEVTLIESMPQIIARTNGAAIGSKMKGNFRLKDIGSAKLFVDMEKPPFIYIKREAKPVFINCDTADSTKELYNALVNEREKLTK